MATVAEPLAMSEAIAQRSHARALVVVDCLTLWLANLMMPPLSEKPEKPDNSGKYPSNQPVALVHHAWIATVLIAIEKSAGSVVLVSNEIGLGVIPMGAEVRAFGDALGCLNQSVAKACNRVTLMTAGSPQALKGVQ